MGRPLSAALSTSAGRDGGSSAPVGTDRDHAMRPDRTSTDDEKPRALIADDDPVVRAALRAQLDREFSVVGCVEDADQAIEAAAHHRPTVALVDVEMPGGGLRATEGIRRVSPETAIVILTSDERRFSVLEFLAAGAVAYLRKGAPLHQLQARIDEAIAAHRAISHRVQRTRIAAEDGFRAAFEQAAVGMAIVSLEGRGAGRVISVNAAYSRMLGRDPVELVGANLERWTHPDDLPDGINDPLATLARESCERVEFEGRYLDSHGQVIHTLATAASYLDEDAHRVAILQVLDISERKRLEEQLGHLASHDPLTGLFNRRRLAEELDRELTRVRRYPGRGAVLALDFDGFKFVNDTLGHAAGDRLVASLADSMKRTLRASDTIARTGGDEFVVILPEASPRAALRVGEKLRANIRRNGVCDSQDGSAGVTTSIGITVFDSDDQVTAADLLVEADMAMYGAKESGRDRCHVFVRDPHRRKQIMARESWLRRLQDAVEQRRFVLHAQPIVPVCATGVPRFELLLRMQDDDGELLAPAAFLPNAERFDLIQGLDHWVMSEAVQLLHRYHAQGCDLALSINVSAKTLSAGAIARHLGALLEAYPIPEGRLVLELAESVTIANLERARELAADLRALGCRLALDDFGAGVTTFHYLKHLEFDYIKIDGEFVERLPENRADQLLVKAVAEVARGLGAETIAEFVQDDETVALLHELGVGYAQGHHTGRPGPLDDILPSLQPVAR